jgi:hypothetical protein
MSSSDSGNNIKKTNRMFFEQFVTAVVVNYSNIQLNRTSYNLTYGEWVTFPPEKIPCSSEVKWESRSGGWLSKTEGSANYESEHGKVAFYWNNPSIGPSIYRVSCPKEYKCQHYGGDDDKAKVVFTITNS